MFSSIEQDLKTSKHEFPCHSNIADYKAAPTARSPHLEYVGK